MVKVYQGSQKQQPFRPGDFSRSEQHPNTVKTNLYTYIRVILRPYLR